MDHQDYEILGRRKGKFNPQIFLNKKVFEIDNIQFKKMQQMDNHDVQNLVLRILKKAIANRENDDVTVLYFYFKDSPFIQKLENKFDNSTLLQIISHITYKKFTRHELVSKQGNEEKQMYFILEGKAFIKSFKACEYLKKDCTFGIRKVCLSRQILSKGDHFCQEILKGKNYDEKKICLFSVGALDQILECGVLRRDHYLGFKISMGIKQEIQKINLIQSSSIFNYHLNPRQLKALSANFHLKKCYCNNIIYNEGEEADSIYIIKNGRFKIQKFTNFNYNFDELEVTNFKMALSKKYSEVAVISEGQCFGDEEILKNLDKRMFTVSCESASGELFVIQKKDFFKVLSQTYKDEDWQEMENAFKIKNQWRKENISSIEKVKQQYVDFVSAPPKYSGEAKFLRMTQNLKKAEAKEAQKTILKTNENQELTSPKYTMTESPQTFQLTEINDQNKFQLSEMSRINTMTSNQYQQKIDMFLSSNDINLTQKSQKIQTENGFFYKSTNISNQSNQGLSNIIQNTAQGTYRKYGEEKIPVNLRSKSVQDDKNLLKLGAMINTKKDHAFESIQTQNTQNQSPYPHQKQLILPEINYKEHTTIDVRHRYPSPWSSLSKRIKENPSNRNGFYSGLSSPTQNDQKIKYYDQNLKRNPYSRNLNGSFNKNNTNNNQTGFSFYDSNNNVQSNRKSQSPNNNMRQIDDDTENEFSLPLKRMDVADIIHNKAIILKTKNFTNEDEKGRIMAFEGARFIPEELDNLYLEKKGVIKKKYDPKKRELINQQSMQKGKKILENFILGYLTKKKKAQSNKQSKEDQENNEQEAHMKIYNFPQGKTNNQFYSKSNKNRFQRRINTYQSRENSLSPIPPPSQENNNKFHYINNNEGQQEYIFQKVHQMDFQPNLNPQNSNSIKENSKQIILSNLEKSPTKQNIQESIKINKQNKSISLLNEQQKKQSQINRNISDSKYQQQAEI